ncbi:glycosyltransferase family 2 protein [Mucilaginibacter sp. JRF]|uniref:glycosyltransferase family 2 protein n=1 Tax=Mucilaginibacter sp. JRF TaxID=2780088 RepID=UPI001882DC0B|nr:glycosyltransferase family 2 protein [Mucilaginibacter sp. JRF]MBE9584863.1 glycosyltransferase family 2 protein [Mucilaginibacter sp. JRF]
MKVSGFTFIRNAVANDYPITEAIRSILPICDEFIVVVGQSTDETRQLIANINSPKVRIIDSVWNDSLKEGGVVFARETDKAYQAISADTDWAFYIQGDEVVHEKYLPLIVKEMEQASHNPAIEGLLFKYLHFYASYDYFGDSRRWYRREIRVIKNLKGIQSYRDAQGFRLNERKIKVKLIDAYIYHYGWAKPLTGLNNKVKNFNKFYHDDEWIKEHVPETYEFDYGNADRLIKFNDTHPGVMQKRIETTRWEIDFKDKPLQKHMDFRRKLLQRVEDITGWRVGEYKNYKIVKR